MRRIVGSEPEVSTATRITVVIPAREEERHILACLEAVQAALNEVGGGEILVVDGMSRDRTRQIVSDFALANPNVILLDNPRRITPAAFNIGIRAAAGPLIAIVSAHSLPTINFFAAGMSRIAAGDADIVGGPIVATPGRAGLTPWLLSMIVRHPFGVGNSRFRISHQAGYVDAVPFAIFRSEVFHQIGLFKECLPRNQDTEFFGRVRGARLRVFMDPAMSSVYFARSTLAGLLRQGFLNAYWNVLVWRHTPAAFRWRHLIPGLFTAGILTSVIVAVWLPAALTVTSLAISSHVIIGIGASVQLSIRTRRVGTWLLPPLFLLFHFVYGCGSIVGLHHLFRRRSQPRDCQPPTERPVHSSGSTP